MTLGNLLSPSEVHLLFELGLKDEMCRMPFTGFRKEVSERLASRAQRSRCSVARVQLGLSSTVQLIWAERKGKALGLEGSTGEEGAVDSELRTQRHTVSRGRHRNRQTVRLYLKLQNFQISVSVLANWHIKV